MAQTRRKKINKIARHLKRYHFFFPFALPSFFSWIETNHSKTISLHILSIDTFHFMSYLDSVFPIQIIFLLLPLAISPFLPSYHSYILSPKCKRKKKKRSTISKTHYGNVKTSDCFNLPCIQIKTHLSFFHYY